MKKTYWWRYGVLVVSLALIEFSYYFGHKVLLGFPVKLYFFCDYVTCLESTWEFGKIIFFLALALLAVSPFLFFVRDELFKKWLRFAGIWLLVAAVLISLAPEYNGGWMSFGPTKESVSILLGELFVIVSLAKLAWASRKGKA